MVWVLYPGAILCGVDFIGKGAENQRGDEDYGFVRYLLLLGGLHVPRVLEFNGDDLADVGVLPHAETTQSKLMRGVKWKSIFACFYLIPFFF